MGIYLQRKNHCTTQYLLPSFVGTFLLDWCIKLTAERRICKIGRIPSFFETTYYEFISKIIDKITSSFENPVLMIKNIKLRFT